MTIELRNLTSEEQARALSETLDLVRAMPPRWINPQAQEMYNQLQEQIYEIYLECQRAIDPLRRQAADLHARYTVSALFVRAPNTWSSTESEKPSSEIKSGPN